MYKKMFVEYTVPEFGTQVQTEVMSWEAFCHLGMEWGVKILFCCSIDDPQLNQP